MCYPKLKQGLQTEINHLNELLEVESSVDRARLTNISSESLDKRDWMLLTPANEVGDEC